jgi:23S rRNA (guanine745-N1)-methyltransferase
VLAIDVAKVGVAHAAARDKRTAYAVANAASVPLADEAVDLCVNIFGPIEVNELGRIVKQGGYLLAAHPGTSHLQELRNLVYQTPRPHEPKDPLRSRRDLFERTSTLSLQYKMKIDEPQLALDLYTMTPYRWHAVPGIEETLIHRAEEGLELTADFSLSLYRRTEEPVYRDLGNLRPSSLPRLASSAPDRVFTEIHELHTSSNS